VTIVSIAHAISPAVLNSIQRLDFSLSEWQRNPRIGNLLGKTVLSGGKRLRPLMTFMMADLVGVPHATIEPFSRYIELVHASTLAHDDVIDNAEYRRGEPSINIVASNKQAVLAGDYLLAYVLQEIAQTGRNDLVSEMAAIIADLAEGEWLQIENSVKKDLTRADVERVALKKTGSVLRWSCAAPALLAYPNGYLLPEARRLGEAIGIAFQMTDDILDFKRRDGSEGADIKNRVINAVIFEALCLTHDREQLDMTRIDSIEPDPRTLDLAIERVRQRVDHLVEEANTLLEMLSEATESRRGQKDPQSLAALKVLVNYLAQRI
jgi:geranylgeranyl pyrophosphate synthase